MGLTTAMFTALTGMNASQYRIDTVGDNIANVNTTAFKSNRANFENQLSLTMSAGTGPGATTGGTNPVQIGLGTMLGSVQRNTAGGAVETTGVPTDMAVEGAGYFIVRAPGDQLAYTRDGSFQLDSKNNLVTADGYLVQGYGVDANFQITPGPLKDLTIPLGSLSTAKATGQANFDGNLNANGDVATQGSVHQSQALQGAGGATATADTLLVDLFDPASPSAPLFASGDVITVQNAQKGGRQLPSSSFTVTDTSTLAEYMTFLQNALGINQDSNAPGSPGVRLSSDTDPGGAGRIIVEGNSGTANALTLDTTAIRSTNADFSNPFQFDQTQAANGESLFTSFIAYDSLGTPVLANLTVVLDQKTNAGTTWRFYAESADDTDASPVLGPTGTIAFDVNGKLMAVTNNEVRIDRAATGAATPLQINLDFSKVTGLTSQTSTLVMTTQDGFSSGTLSNFSVGTDGVLNGTFSNGMTQKLGQVVLARFVNEEGLISKNNNLYITGPNSGEPVIVTPEQFGAGRIRGGALELSNVDLTREFIGLITASTAFSASGRVLSTSNDLLNELLVLAR